MAVQPKPPAPDKSGLHPRNRHRGRYDFPELCASYPPLAPFVRPTGFGDTSIDFADPAAVKALNRAILKHFYGVEHWDLPPGYLCPPIPGRADYLHHLADLLARDHGGVIPRGPGLRVLDVGVGANCVYPLLGHHDYGWRFLGSDVDPQALACAQAILEANAGLAQAIELRLQPRPDRMLQGLLREGETFDLTLCNPPFHASAQEARAGSERKWRNLGRGEGAPVLNFGGQARELWCPGGEEAFVRAMVRESADLKARCLWFSTLVSKEAHQAGVHRALKSVGALGRTVPMAQGQKRSRLVAWTFQDEGQRAGWAKERWG
jgi:23S rRNA (adenine1618-N6)-methyltransferase